MLDVEDRICQRLAKEFGLDVREIQRIERSQFKQVTNCFRSFEGKAFAIPYLGEFAVLPNKERYLEVCRMSKEIEE